MTSPPAAPPSDLAILGGVLALARPHWRRLAAGAIAGFLCNASSVGLIAVSAWLISRASQRPEILSLSIAIVCVRALGVSRGLLRYIERLVTHDAGFRLLADIRVALYRAIEPLAPLGLVAERSGDVLRRLVGDVDRLQVLYTRILLPPAIAALTVIATVALVTTVLPIAGLVAAAGLLTAAVAVPWLSARLTSAAAATTAERRGELHAAVVDLLQGLPDLVANGAADAQRARIAELDGDLCDRARHQATVAAMGSAAVLLIAGLTVTATLLVAIPPVAAGTVDGTMLAVLALVPLAAFEPVAALSAGVSELGDALGSARRVLDILGRTPLVRDPVSPAVCPEDTTVAFEDVRVVHAGRPGAAVGDVSAVIAPGRRIVVTGPSGCGKTTLAHALVRFVPLAAGRITLGGVDTASLRQADVRRRIGLVEDEARLFATSIRENLRIARPDADDAELRDAAIRARLADWVDSLPDGWDTLVGERGVLVSGGQRRRIALARALLADFPVLILDEPTAHLDAETSGAVMRELLEATRGRTTVVITHDLEAVPGADEVWRMEAGRIVLDEPRGARPDPAAAATAG